MPRHQVPRPQLWRQAYLSLFDGLLSCRYRYIATARHTAPTTPVGHTKSSFDPETRPTMDPIIVRTDPTAIRATGSLGFDFTERGRRQAAGGRIG